MAEKYATVDFFDDFADLRQSPTTNPFGLADGLRYYIHHVEEYNSVHVRPPRRSVSASYNGQPLPSASAVLSSTHPQLPANKTIDNPVLPMTSARPRSSSAGYSPIVATLTDLISPEDTQRESLPITVDSSAFEPSTSLPQAQIDVKPALSPTFAPPDDVKLSPRTAGIPVPMHIRQRLPSRPSPPSFAPSSLGRPNSVASSASSHFGVPVSAVTPSKSTPTMAVTKSGDSIESPGLLEVQRRVLRKISSNSLSPAREDLFRASMSREVPPTMDTYNSAVSLDQVDGKGSGFAALGTGSAGRLIRGFSIGKKRTTSGLSLGMDGKPTAMDMLRRFEGAGS